MSLTVFISRGSITSLSDVQQFCLTGERGMALALVIDYNCLRCFFL